MKSPEGLTFTEKADKLRSIVGLLSEDEDVSKVLEFVPKVPEVCMVHCVINAPASACLRAADETATATDGVRVFSRLRGDYKGDAGRQYFEWNMGDANGAVEEGVFLKAWKIFAAKVTEAARFDEL